MENELLNFQTAWWEAMSYGDRIKAGKVEKDFQKFSENEEHIMKKKSELEILKEIYSQINYLDSLVFSHSNARNVDDFIDFLKESKSHRDALIKFSESNENINCKKFVIANNFLQEKLSELENPKIEFEMFKQSVKNFQTELESEISSSDSDSSSSSE